MKKWGRKIVGGLCLMLLLFADVVPALSVTAADSVDENAVIIEPSDVPLRLHYDEEASHGVAEGYDETYKWYTMSVSKIDEYVNDDWERWSLPIGNGYFGANLFGRTETERIQISEQSLYNTYKATASDGTSYEPGGYNSFSETYIDFGHTNSDVSNYSRWLDLKTAISGVQYDYDGVTYTREYFTSYPDKVLVIRLDASTEGKLNFTLRPKIPWEQDYAQYEGDGYTKQGTVTSSIAENGNGIIELSGKMGYYDIDFLGIYTVVTDSGTVSASTAEHTYTDTAGISHTDTDGTIIVEGAKSAYIYVNLGTDYELSSEMFTTTTVTEKPTFDTDIEYTRTKIQAEADAVAKLIADKSYEDAYSVLRSRHVEDYSEIFGRVSLDLGCTEDALLTTDALLEKYKNGEYSTYLEALYFQYGRYLIIASSRENSLPANLQGVWNRYNKTPWSGGYWHNINVQMNYWAAFSTNMSETFEAYVKYNQAYMEQAENNADAYVDKYNSSVSGEDGGNGWCIGIGTWPYSITGDRSAGNLGFLTQLYWEYYQYTQDKELLEEVVFPMLTSAARFIVKMVELDEEGNYLISHCDSPEMFVNGVWYYTKGTTYAQTFAYLNNYNALCAAKELGINLSDESVLSSEEYSIFATVMEQIDKYDPIIVGLSGQIKEFREEDYYCSVGDDPHHRHISQLVGLYPGNIINATTPAWLDAAEITLTERGDVANGWSVAHRLTLWSRTKNGERARDLLKQLLTCNTATNLWDICPPFCIDGNAGGTAGIGEMLLQSHEGYIEPLAALPSAWSTGSYTGLVARGNFEVSAAWESGVAKVFNIISNTGGTANVYYPTITSAKVITSSGAKVDYTVTGDNLISFETEVGETYIITGFTAVESIESPKTVSFVRDGRFGAFTLEWSAVEDAASYNVYAAVESAPMYTFVGNTTNLQCVYIPGENEENARTTFAVTAVSSDGAESKRTLCYYVPEDTSAAVEKISASVSENGELQVVVEANINTGAYRLYEKILGETKYTLVAESEFPILYSGSYTESNSYAVTGISYYTGEESEFYVINSFTSAPLTYDASNIFVGKTFDAVTGTDYTIVSGYEWEKLTDGIIDPSDYTNGRFSTSTNKKADATIDLEGTYILSELRFYLFQKNIVKAGTNFTVQVYSEGEWVTVIDSLSNDDLKRYCKTVGTGNDGAILLFDLGLIKGSKIRFYAECVSDEAITFYEAECYGILLESKFGHSDNILIGKEFIGSEAVITAGGVVFGYDKLNDGIISGTWNVGRYGSATSGKMNGTVDLGGAYRLDKLRLYDFQQNSLYVGNNLKIEYYNGGWNTLLFIEDNADLINYRVSNGSGLGKAWLEFDFNGTIAEKIRISSDSITDYTVSLYEIECSGTLCYDKFESIDNIFSDKQFIGNEAVITAGGVVFGYDKLNDGIISGTWNVGRYGSATSGKMNGTVDFGEIYRLETIRFYAFNKNVTYAGNNLKVEVYYGGEWKTLVYVEDYTDLSAYMVSNSTSITDTYIEFDLGGAYAEMVRVSSDAVTGSTVSFYEIECSGAKPSIQTLENESTNALSGSTATVDGTEESAENVIDGNIDTYLEVSGAASYSVTLEISTPNVLYTLKIYELIESSNLIDGVFATASDSTKVEIYRNGAWITIADGISLDPDSEYTEIYLYGTECSKIRVTFTNTRLFDGEIEYRSAKIKEITCTAADAAYVDRKSLLEAYKELLDINSSDETHIAQMEIFKSYLTDITLTEGDIEACIVEMNDYREDFISSSVSDIGFAPKMSITLANSFIMNVYVPVNCTEEFTFGGVTYNADNSFGGSVVTLDGEDYYLVTVDLGSSEAAKDMKLVAKVNVNESTATATFTFSIPKYASKLLNDAGATEVEKQLIKDVLAYIQSAYSYFAEHNTVEEIERVNALVNELLLIGGEYSGEPNLDGTSEHNTSLVSAVTLILDAKPTIRFYVKDTNVKFYIGEKLLNTKSGTDEYENLYVDLDVYAYALSETITYKLGEESGNYHISDYVYKTEADTDAENYDNLVNLVYCFVKYVESAADYRESVIGSNN